MFHLTASKIQIIFYWNCSSLTSSKTLKQSICSHRANTNQNQQTLFNLLCPSVRKKIKNKSQRRSSELFLSSTLPARDWRLSHPLCPISPQKEGEIRTTFRSNLLRLSVLLQKLTSIQTLTLSQTHTYICTYQQYPSHSHHHQSGNMWPSGSVQCSFS